MQREVSPAFGQNTVPVRHVPQIVKVEMTKPMAFHISTSIQWVAKKVKLCADSATSPPHDNKKQRICIRWKGGQGVATNGKYLLLPN